DHMTNIILSGGFSPSHRALHRIFANPMKTQLTEITHIFMGQPLIVFLLMVRRSNGCAPIQLFVCRLIAWWHMMTGQVLSFAGVTKNCQIKLEGSIFASAHGHY